jgi:hypothetical protein
MVAEIRGKSFKLSSSLSPGAWGLRAIGRTALTLASLLMILALMLPSASYVLAQQSKAGAIVFHLELYDERGRPITGLGALSKSSELEVFAQVYAITPPDDPDVLKEVYKGKVRGLKLRLEARGALKDVAEGWVRFEEKRGPVTRDSETAVQLNLWIVNKTSGEVVQRVSYYYTYSPKGILEGEERAHKVKIAVPKKAKGASGSEIEADIRVANGCYSFFYWKPVYRITPDTYVQAGGPPEVYNHLLRRDGTLYIRTPLLTIYNAYRPSSPITATIEYGSERYTWFYVAIGIGFEVEKKLKKGDITGGLSGKVYLGGKSLDMKVSFIRTVENVQSWEEAYIWIWARPVYIFYHEYYVNCLGYETYTGRDKVEFFVQDVVKTYNPQLKVYYIEGGVRREPLPSFIREWIFNSTLTEYVSTYSLRPSEAIRLRDFLETYVDTCSADFEVPPAPVLAAAVRRVATHLVPLSVMIGPSISWGESETRYVGGGIQNNGQYYEYLYMRQSNLSYRKDPPWWCFWCSPCYYKIPVSLYIESR